VPKVTFIGAGSTVFARKLVGDILSFPEFGEAEICLHDIDKDRLRTSEIVSRHIAEGSRTHPVISATTDRREALAGADYVITMFRVGGYEPATVNDFKIPEKYGLRQTIGDTLGIGGIMRGLRTIPVMLDICRDMEELCPHALLLNYVNPMAMICWALSRATKIRTIGLCHSVQGTSARLASDIGVPEAEIDYLCAGINHMAFYLRFERKNSGNPEDLYPSLHRLWQEDRVPENNRVRYEMLRRMGYFVTESSEHFAEYVPWFIKRDRPDLLERFNIPLDEHLRRCERREAEWEGQRAELEKGENLDVQRSNEYGTRIIHSLETGMVRTFYGNVCNDGLIANLPADCCVEVPCRVDKRGIEPQKVGAIPPHLAALMQTNINVQSLVVEAALSGKREHVYHAAMLDPHTAAELDLDQIWNLVDELLEAHREWLPGLGL
jgi:alpha-galactosidase